jgi:phosphohistidine phosphatase
VRRLILLRHGESALNPGGTDAERTLTANGREQAAAVGRYLKDQQLLPDLALVSSSARTRETFELVQGALGPIESGWSRTSTTLLRSGLQALVEAAEAEVRALLSSGTIPGWKSLQRR